MIVRQAFRFEAAHRLPLHPGKCFNLHGHSYRFSLTLDLPVDAETGMTIDFAEIGLLALGFSRITKSGIFFGLAAAGGLWVLYVSVKMGISLLF